MKRRNFVFIGFVDAKNGAATFFKTLIESIEALEVGVKVKFYCQGLAADTSSNTTNQEDESSLKERLKVQFRSYLYIFSKYSYLISFLALEMLIFRHAKRVVNQIKKIESNDSWVFNDIFTAYFFLKRYPDAKDLTLILHNDGVPSRMLIGDYPKLARGVLRRITESRILHVLKKLDKIIFLSPSSKQRFEDNYVDEEIKAQKYVIGNGVALPYKTPTRSDDGYIIGVSVGSINKRKGFDMLVGAMKKLNTKANRIKIYCIGERSDVTIIESAVGIDNLIFTGPKNRDQIAQYIANADFYTLCSRDEGMPISIIEAMQYSLPILVTDVGAVNQMFCDGIEGILMQPTQDSIFKSLERLSNGELNLSQMGINARATYERRYTVETMINNYNNVLS